MAIARDLPYGNSRFRVQIDNVDELAFGEVLVPELSVQVAEYREGGDKEGQSRLVPGRPQVGRLVLRRGFTGSLALYAWYRQVADGAADARRTVTVQLFDEGMTAVVAVWRLRRAWPSRYAVSPLVALGGGPVVEELEVVGDRLELE